MPERSLHEAQIPGLFVEPSGEGVTAEWTEAGRLMPGSFTLAQRCLSAQLESMGQVIKAIGTQRFTV
jgi:hypothetical protein